LLALFFLRKDRHSHPPAGSKDAEGLAQRCRWISGELDGVKSRYDIKRAIWPGQTLHIANAEIPLRNALAGEFD
jgi:hypothetical protein